MITVKPTQIVGIDCIRFFAACTVMLFHFCYVYPTWVDKQNLTKIGSTQAAGGFPPPEFFRFGFVGVHIFFVVSGFIIAYSAHNAEPYEFFRSRLVRLMPAVWIIAPITAAVWLVLGTMPWDDLSMRFVRSILLFPVGPWVDGVYWTLPVELMFYTVVFALLCFRRFALIGSVLATIGIISAIYNCFDRLGYNLLAMTSLPPEVTTKISQLTLLDFGCFFAVGVFLWLSLNWPTTQRTLLLIVLTASCLTQTGGRGSSGIWLLSVVAIFLSVKFNAVFAARDRLQRVARVLGLTTYPLYLLHDVVGSALIGYQVRGGFDRRLATVVSIATVICAAVSIAVFFEPALQKRTKRALDHIFGARSGLATQSR